MSACLSMVLNIPLQEVPNFFDRCGEMDEGHGQRWNEALDAWLSDRGLVRLNFKPFDGWDSMLKGFVVVSGPSPRSGMGWHAVVYWDGKLWHDPHPDRSGVLEVGDIEIYYPLSYAWLKEKH